jgi:hypothetical protein
MAKSLANFDLGAVEGQPSYALKVAVAQYALDMQNGILGSGGLGLHIDDVFTKKTDLDEKFAAHRGPLLNLLALIHRDGGEHTDSVGIHQSYEDAVRVWAKLRVKEDTLAAADLALHAVNKMELEIENLVEYGTSESCEEEELARYKADHRAAWAVYDAAYAVYASGMEPILSQKEAAENALVEAATELRDTYVANLPACEECTHVDCTAIRKYDTALRVYQGFAEK